MSQASLNAQAMCNVRARAVPRYHWGHKQDLFIHTHSLKKGSAPGHAKEKKHRIIES